MQDRPATAISDERQYVASCCHWLRRHATVVEAVLLASVGAFTLLAVRFKADAYVMLSLYFLPVTMAGILLGRKSAGRSSLFCITLAITLLTSNQSGPTPWTTLAVWSGVLGIQAVVIGALCSDQRSEMDRLRELHRTDTLSDALTGVANRRAFDYELNRRMAEWNRQRQPLSLMLLDIDHFKRLNDTYGHQAGDRVIHDVAQLLAGHCRETDLVARYGGEEFAVVMPNTPCSEGMKLAERVRCVIEAARFEVGGLSIKTSVSVGLAQLAKNEEIASFVARVDTALYSSKQAGRNCSHVHDDQACRPFGAQTIGGATPADFEDDRPKRPVSASLAHTDSVTGLPTKSVFIDELRRRLSESRRYGSDLALMIVQIDEQCEIGQAPSDEVQSIIAEHIRYIVRDSDLVASYSSDQFVIVMPSTAKHDAITPAVRLRRRVAQCRNNVCQELPSQLTVSVGLTEYTDEDTVATILQRADQALECGRTAGGNRVSVFSDDGCGPINIDDEVEVIDAVQ